MTDIMASNSETNVLPDAPYRGVEPFRYIDQKIFFGREKDIAEVSRLISLYKGSLLFGSSGTGKSSLINAGIIPLLIDEYQCVDRLRLNSVPVAIEDAKGGKLTDKVFKIEKIKNVKTTENDSYLAVSCFGGEKEWVSDSDTLYISSDQLKTTLRNRFYGKETIVENDKKPFSVLLFDQFEELITLFEEAPHTGELKSKKMLQQNITNILVDILNDDRYRVKILFIYREDYFGKLNKFFGDSPNLLSHSYRLEPLEINKLQKIIRGPFEDPELKKSYGTDAEIPAEVADLMIAEFKGRYSATNNIDLTEVQIPCQKLWQIAIEKHQDLKADYFAAGGIKGILEGYLNSSLSKLSEEDKDLAIQILSEMVIGTARIPLSDRALRGIINEDKKYPEEKIDRILYFLENEAKLIKKEWRSSDSIYEILSEFLVPVISKEKNIRLADEENLKIIAQQKKELEIKQGQIEMAQMKYKNRMYLTAIGLIIILVCCVFALNNYFEGKIIVFTGFRDEELKNLIEKMGGKITTSVSSKTFLVVYNDDEITSLKLKKANELEIKIINKTDFNKLVEKYNI